jgi:UDP-N-acetylglucosamine 2-epimerase (non-hydrolysing)/GDP/UDP-N,N'-diacetylbacillosamine 2-epimerase (hydrolysing)
VTRRRIAAVTTSRADFGNLRWLLEEIHRDRRLELQLIVSGMHLDPHFGQTAAEIEETGLPVARRLPMLLVGDDPLAATKSIGVGVLSFADALNQLAPDMLLLLGDRFEILAPAIAAFMQRIPIAHVHGGETSQGALDEGVRHAVTKLATWHFPATDAYARRIRQMGEPAERVFMFGAPGIDALHRLRLLSRAALARTLQFSLEPPVALVTYHPVTLEPGTGRQHVRALLRALDDTGVRAIVTAANADPEGRAINEETDAFCARYPERFKRVQNLGHRLYFSCLAHCALVAGNSSSGLVEAPSFRIPVVNIGARQQGRVRAGNVIDVDVTQSAIAAGIHRALSPEFRRSIRGVVNPYDPRNDGHNSRRIKEQLARLAITPDVRKKQFVDLTVEGSV